VGVVADALHEVRFDANVLVAFGVDEDLLATLLILKAQLVETAAALRTERFDGALGLLAGQSIRRHLVRVVDAACNHGPVRIAFEKVDDHLLPDPRSPYGAPLLASPKLRDTRPAGAVFIALAGAVPEELYLRAAVLVDVDFFAAGPHDNSCLRTL